jgi:3-(3-hydroxy-phenyl)propionate hydroxylase
MPNQMRRWEFMLFPNELEEEVFMPGTLQRLIAQTNFSKHSSSSSTPSQQATEPTRQAIYTFHKLLASSFSQGRIFLLGDAAHLMPPFGGQGLNSGLRDAYNLCWKLAYVLQTGRSVELLESYQRERAPHTTSMIRFSALLGQAIMPTQPILASIRDGFFRGINLIPQIREILNEMKVKPAARYPQTTSSLLKLKKTVIGTLLPQTHVLGTGGQTLLLDELLGQGFTLLRLSHTKNSAEIRGEIFYLDSAPFTSAQPEQGKHGANTRFLVVDQQQQLSRVTRQSHGRWLLLRPDHFILDMLPGQQKPARKTNAYKDRAADRILFYRYHNDLHQPQ